jgi:capsular polysaccharide transport system permease protein
MWSPRSVNRHRRSALQTSEAGLSRIIEPMLRRFMDRLKGINSLFLLIVVLPTVLACLYFGVFASDVFISESRFVVRSPQKQSTTGLGAILQGAGFTRSQDDTYTVNDYILSRDALQQLEQSFQLSKAYGSVHVDRISRFAGIDPDNSFEAFHRYYQKHVNLVVDGVSSITVLRTSAFAAADAHRMNEKLLELSEKLINQLNERGRQDMIKFAASEVAAAEQTAKAATMAVSQFRTQKGVFDPERQSTLQLQLVSKLQDELIATKTQLAQVREIARDNPQISSLQKKLDTLQAEISAETAKVAGGERSLSSKSADFERLSLERAFADKQLATALTSLEQAKNEAQRKQLYLERIVQPNLPDMAVEPRRLRSILATFVLGMVAWGVISMLVAGVREHRQ